MKDASMLEIAKIATMNMTLLKEMDVQEVLHLHPLLDPHQLKFVKVQKTKPIKVKALSTILSDDSVMNKILLSTLEGHQDLKANSFVCWGIDNDVWQSTGKAIHSKYFPVSLDEQGWTTFKPIENFPVDACLITGYSEDVPLGPFQGFSVPNPAWGDNRVIEGKNTY